jgi:hypothetical protein
MKSDYLHWMLGGVALAAATLLPQASFAHCDTMDGPVVTATRSALAKRDVSPVLKWVQKQDEPGIRAAFSKTLVVRDKGREARELADQFFFETLVRVHRAGEGAPYTGLKPAGSTIDPALAEADKALETGSVDPVVRMLVSHASTGVRQRFAKLQVKSKHAEESVEAGREYVAAYVEYVHYVEGLHHAARGAQSHAIQHEAAVADAPHHHHEGGAPVPEGAEP